MTKHAIFGTDFSKAVSEIIDNSEMLKTIGIEKITLIHVLNLRDKIMVEQFTIEGLEQKLAQQKNALKQMGFEVDSEFVFGIPHLELERFRKEKGAGLIIAGSHGRTGSASTMGGTIADILQNMKAPVLVIPLRKKEAEEDEFPGKNLYQYEQIMQHLEKQEPEWVVKCNTLVDHVLFPTDFSDFSEQAFQWLKGLTVQLPRLTLLHVQDEVKIGKHLSHKLEEFNVIDRERLIRMKDSFSSSHPETTIDFKVIYGKPIQVILNYIKENGITTTVMGSQGRGFMAGIFIGSVSHQVARHSNSNGLFVSIPKG